GHIAKHQGDSVAAFAYLADSLVNIREVGHQPTVAACLAGLAGVAGGQRHPERAARLFGAAAALCDRLTAPVHDIEQERDIAVARVQLDDVAWAAAWAEG